MVSWNLNVPCVSEVMNDTSSGHHGVNMTCLIPTRWATSSYKWSCNHYKPYNFGNLGHHPFFNDYNCLRLFEKIQKIPNLHVQHVLARALLEDRSDNTLPQWRGNRQQHWHHLDVVLLLTAMLTLAQNDAKKHMNTYGVFWIMWPSKTSGFLSQ